jgi:hypothetical protein
MLHPSPIANKTADHLDMSSSIHQCCTLFVIGFDTSNFNFAGDKVRCRHRINRVGQVGRVHNDGVIADQVGRKAKGIHNGWADVLDWAALVWVTKEHDSLDSCGSSGLEQGGTVMHELCSLRVAREDNLCVRALRGSFLGESSQGFGAGRIAALKVAKE